MAEESELLLRTQLPLAVAELVGEVLSFGECECLGAQGSKLLVVGLPEAIGLRAVL